MEKVQTSEKCIVHLMLWFEMFKTMIIYASGVELLRYLFYQYYYIIWTGAISYNLYVVLSINLNFMDKEFFMPIPFFFLQNTKGFQLFYIFNPIQSVLGS